MKLSVVIPAHNEEGCLSETVSQVVTVLQRESIPHEVLIINDNSTDRTLPLCQQLSRTHSTVRFINNEPPNGFGFAVRRGLAEFSGDAVAIVMADASDDPEDLVAGYHKLHQGYDCVFGSRFVKGGKVIDYPAHKLLVNRLANWFIKVIFRLRYNDTTNAFKLYRREVIEGIQPILSHHFNLTVELPLKAVVRGFSFAVIPIRWYNRTTGVSKLKIKEMGSRYLFIVLYIWLEKHLSRGDYHRSQTAVEFQNMNAEKQNA
jgi:dolichol-phosphate mannosyltransferase